MASHMAGTKMQVCMHHRTAQLDLAPVGESSVPSTSVRRGHESLQVLRKHLFSTFAMPPPACPEEHQQYKMLQWLIMRHGRSSITPAALPASLALPLYHRSTALTDSFGTSVQIHLTIAKPVDVSSGYSRCPTQILLYTHNKRRLLSGQSNNVCVAGLT